MKLASFFLGSSMVLDCLIYVVFFSRLDQLIHHFVFNGFNFNFSPKMPKAHLKTDNRNKITEF